MTRHYCTLFDSRYLPQGLALYESLKKHSSEEFRLYILAMDTECHAALDAMALPRVETIRLAPFEELMRLGYIRATRTWMEYCWSLASILTESLLHQSGRIEVTHTESTEPEYVDGMVPYIDSLTYLDADLMFFSDPKVIHDEIGDRSIAVIPHRWNEKDRKRLEPNGKFNVSWVTFKNNAIGRECLSTWARQCRERCSAKVGCGDQLYLDEFVKYGSELCVIQNIGAGVAPWNLQNYVVSLGPKVDGRDIVFYHFHETRRDANGTFNLTNYTLRSGDVNAIYVPYMSAWKEAQDRIDSVCLQGDRA